MSDSTLTLNKNVVSRKKLIGIAKNIGDQSLARILSQGSELLSTEQEIRDTKQANVLLPHLIGFKDVKDVLTQAQAGAITADELPLSERIVQLANEKVTNPSIWRPRDGEVIQADSLAGRYQSGFVVTGVAAKDTAYFNTLLASGTAGVVGSKSEIVVVDNSGAEAEKATKFTSAVRQARARIKKHKDALSVNVRPNSQIAIVVDSFGELELQNDARYNIYAGDAFRETGTGMVAAGALDGSPVYVSNFLPVGVNFAVMVKGSATSVFAIRNKMNFDKVPGLDAYLMSMEFDEGTGVWMPALITFGSNKFEDDGTTANGDILTAQVAVGIGTFDGTGMAASTTTGQNPA